VSGRTDTSNSSRNRQRLLKLQTKETGTVLQVILPDDPDDEALRLHELDGERQR